MNGRERPYLSYLLRLWLVEDDRLVWRASLEAPGHAGRHGFTTLDELIAFLQAETRDLAADEKWRQRTDMAHTAPNREFHDLIGRAAADEAFRSQLLADPERALGQGAYDLTAEQLAGLLETDRGGIAEGLDRRLNKAIRADLGLF